MRATCTHCVCHHTEGNHCCFCGAPAKALSGDVLAAMHVEWQQRQRKQVDELERLYKLEEPNDETT